MNHSLFPEIINQSCSQSSCMTWKQLLGWINQSLPDTWISDMTHKSHGYMLIFHQSENFIYNWKLKNTYCEQVLNTHGIVKWYVLEMQKFTCAKYCFSPNSKLICLTEFASTCACSNTSLFYMKNIVMYN